MKYTFFILFILGITLTHCTTTQKPAHRALFTPAVAKNLLKKGITTQAEILSHWGAPNMVTRNSNGKEVWSYSKQSFDASNRAGGAGFIFGGVTGAVSSASTSSFEVLITFDSRDIVQDFSITATKY